MPHYVAALIEALAYGNSGRSRGAKTTDVTDLMLNLKLADGDYECAVSHVAPYKQSRNEAVSVSAKTADMVFVSLVKMRRSGELSTVA